MNFINGVIAKDISVGKKLTHNGLGLCAGKELFIQKFNTEQMTREEVEQKYDVFFGTGYWEKDYKKHIVEFTFQCLTGAKPIVKCSLPPLVEVLKDRIANASGGPDDRSWGYEEGILISKNEAENIVALLAANCI